MEGSPGIEDSGKSEAHLTSAAAFVEVGIQDAWDDTCSICLEAFYLLAERPQLVKKNMQLHSVDQQRSQALEAHAASGSI